MAERFLVDTDILIDYLKGHPAAIAFVGANAERIMLSTMSVAELYAGVRGDAGDPEQVAISELLDLFPVVAIDSQVAKAGGLYRRDYGKSHGVGLADAVVAATADVASASVKTLNIRHYPMFVGLEPAYRK